MRVAVCQFDIAWEDKPANFARVRKLVADAALPAGTFLLLPEMFATGFSMNAAAIAEVPDGPTFAFLADLARRGDLFVMGGVAVVAANGGKPLNEAVTFGPDGRLISRSAKMHVFTHAGEPDHYAAGERYAAFAWQGATVAPAVCYDLRFPELFRMGMLAGAELFAVIANWPAARASHWLALLRARAIENQAYVAAVNRCGSDPNAPYAGQSVIIDPRGEIVADAGAGEAIVSADVDLEKLREYRATFTAIADVRADLIGTRLRPAGTALSHPPESIYPPSRRV